MKRKFLALAFVAAMTMGLAKTAGSNDWQCVTGTLECDAWRAHTVMVCGDNPTQRREQLWTWREILCSYYTEVIE